MARAHGAAEVIAINPVAERRELAAMLGADIAISPDELPEGRFADTALDAAIDCTGLKVSDGIRSIEHRIKSPKKFPTLPTEFWSAVCV